MFISIVAGEDSKSGGRWALHLEVMHINISHIVSLQKSNYMRIDHWDMKKLINEDGDEYNPFPITLAKDLFSVNEEDNECSIEGCKIVLNDKELTSPEPLQHFIDRCEAERLNRMTGLVTKLKEAHPDLDRQTVEYLSRSLEI